MINYKITETAIKGVIADGQLEGYETQLEKLTLSQLAELYNSLVKAAGENKFVKRFSSKQAALKRLNKLDKELEKVPVDKVEKLLRSLKPKRVYPTEPIPFREGTKWAITADLLRRPQGATVDEICKAARRNEANVRASFTWGMRLHGFRVERIPNTDPQRYQLTWDRRYPFPEHIKRKNRIPKKLKAKEGDTIAERVFLEQASKRVIGYAKEADKIVWEKAVATVTACLNGKHIELRTLDGKEGAVYEDGSAIIPADGLRACFVTDIDKLKKHAKRSGVELNLNEVEL